MANSVLTFPTVDAFRQAANEHFSKHIAEGVEYDARDIERFRTVDEYATMFIQYGQYGKTFDEAKGLQQFHDVMHWRQQNKAYDVSTDQFPANYFQRRGVYYENHDINQCRILHFDVRTFVRGQEDNDAIRRFVIYNFEEQLRLYPGQRINLLCDMSGAGIRNVDIDLTKFILNLLVYYYPDLLACMLIYKIPFILQATWKLIRSWLPTEAQRTIKFVDEKTITEYVASDQLSKAMGGSASE